MAKKEKRTDKRALIDKAGSSIYLAVVVASIVLSATIIGGKFVWDLRQYQERVISKQTEARDTLDANIQTAEQLKEAFQQLEQNEDVTSVEILDALPSKYDFPAIASSFEKISKDADYGLDQFTGDDEILDSVKSATNPEPVEITFNVTVEGSYKDIQDFVKDMQRSIRAFRLNQISITPDSESNFKLDTEITTWYQPSKSLEITKEKVQ